MPAKKMKIDKGLMGNNLPNPYDKNFLNLSSEKLFQSYKMGLKRVNQRMRELEKQGLENFSPVYTSLRSKGITTKRGNVGFSQTISQKTFKSTPKSTFLKEYKKIYKAYTAESSSVQKTREIQEEQLSRLGIDVDEMLKHKELYKEELNQYWALYTELDNRGVFADFGLASTEAQGAVKKYLAENPSPKSKGSVKGMATNIKKLWNEVNSNAAKDPMHTVDNARYNEFVGKYKDNHEKLESSYRRMAYILAQKNYGTKPAEPAFSDKERRFLL